MKKKVLFSLACVVTVVSSAAMFAAFEAHHVQVTATISNALEVNKGSIAYGQVFPQEVLEDKFTVSLTKKFKDNSAISRESIQWVSEAVATTNTTSTLADITNRVAGPVDGRSYGMARKEQLVVKFNQNVSASNNTLEITAYEGENSVGYRECIYVEASTASSYDNPAAMNWQKLKGANGQYKQCRSLTKDALVENAKLYFELGNLTGVKYLRITDDSSKTPGTQGDDNGNSFDLNAISAITRTAGSTVNYMVRQKPLCKDANGIYSSVTEDANGNFVCEENGAEMLPILCTYLKVDKGDNNIVPPFKGDNKNYNMSVVTERQLNSVLTNDTNVSETFNVTLFAPCYEGQCAQDWNSFVKNANPNATNPKGYQLPQNVKDKELGCDLWVEVTGINRK